MIKSLLLVAAFGLGTAAIAQDAGTQAGATATPPAQAMPDSSTTAPPAPEATAPAASGTTGTDAGMSTGGNAGMSTGASAGMGSDATTMPGAGATASASADTSNYPPCSSTVTDRCVQKGSARHMRHRR